MNQELRIKNQVRPKTPSTNLEGSLSLNSYFVILNSQRGFTLLEMIVSFGIFTMLVVAAIGITLGVSNAQIKASNTQAIIDNIRFSLELITKEMRTGSQYQLTTICVGNPTELGSEISFLTSLGDVRVYFLNSSTKTLMRAKEAIAPTDCLLANKVRPFTSDEVLVERLNFSELTGDATGPADGQPRVTVSMKVKSKSAKYHLESTMELQTTVVQRLRDL